MNKQYAHLHTMAKSSVKFQNDGPKTVGEVAHTRHPLTIRVLLTAKLLRQGYRYFKLRKAFLKFYRRHSALLEKYSVSLKTLLQQGISETPTDYKSFRKKKKKTTKLTKRKKTKLTKRKKLKKSDNYEQTICTSTRHGQNICEVSKWLAKNCRSCAHKSIVDERTGHGMPISHLR